MSHIELEIGAVRAWLLDCGLFRFDGGLIFGAVPKLSWQKYYEADDSNHITLAVRPLLIRDRGQYILVNTGMPADERGHGFMFLSPGPQSIEDALADVGVRPQEIALVVLTHLHVDHLGGGLVYEGGQLLPTFPSARYVVQRSELAAASFPNERTRADYAGQEIEALRQMEQLSMVAGSQQLSRSVWVKPAPGHTPGHQCVVLRDGASSAVYVSDLAVVPVQAERLAWISALDTHPMTSLESKREILGAAADAGSTLLFEHEPSDTQAVGQLVRQERRWRYVPGI